MCDVLVFLWVFFLVWSPQLLHFVVLCCCWLVLNSDSVGWNQMGNASTSEWFMRSCILECVAWKISMCALWWLDSTWQSCLAFWLQLSGWICSRPLIAPEAVHLHWKKMCLIYFWRKGVKLHRLSRQEEGHMNGREHLVSFQNQTSPADSRSNITSLPVAPGQESSSQRTFTPLTIRGSS